VTLPAPSLLFGRFEQDAGTKGGAREYFQMLVTDLVKVQFPLASAVEGPGGRDWGIDTFVGTLNGGGLFVWQSKFVLEWNDADPQGPVRTSFKQIVKEANDHGFTVRGWTLCVPCDLSPEQQRWFDGWAGRVRRANGLETVSLWNGTELRHQLMREDARHVRAEYFPHTIVQTVGLGHSPEPPMAPFLTTDDHGQFDGALFVRQLQAAGHQETDAARGLFYATEALFRDYTAKGDAKSLAALEELHLDIHSVWETHFNSESASADERGRMPRLHSLVMASAETRPDPAELRLRPVHKKGAAHRLVEAERAGWVSDWRQVVSEQRAEYPQTTLPGNAAESQPDSGSDGAPAPTLPDQPSPRPWSAGPRAADSTDESIAVGVTTRSSSLALIVESANHNDDDKPVSQAEQAGETYG
jgi:hypothetical protein